MVCSPRAIPLPGALAAAVSSTDDGSGQGPTSIEEIDAAVAAVLVIPRTVDVVMSPSVWREAANAGHARNGCSCGVDEDALTTSADLEAVAAITRCTSEIHRLDQGYPSGLVVALEAARTALESLDRLQTRLSEHSGSSNEDRRRFAVDKLIAWLSMSEAACWQDSAGRTHALYGRPLTARRVRYVTDAVEGVWHSTV